MTGFSEEALQKLYNDELIAIVQETWGAWVAYEKSCCSSKEINFYLCKTGIRVSSF